jgi:predicted DNA-binding protein with PD1-like motif
MTIHRTGRHERTLVIALDEDEDPVRTLDAFVQRHELGGGAISAVGGFSSATLGFVDRARGQHRRISVDQQSEVLSLAGHVAHQNGKRVVHLDVILGLADGTTRGGRLLEASVSPVLEIIVTEEAGHLGRTFDPHLELSLLMPERGPEDVPTVLPSPLDEVPTWLHDLHPARRK